MKLPSLDDPTRYAGLYVVDFGEQTAVGYTAREVEILMDHEAYRDCHVYKIHRAHPNGELELKGVDASRFSLEEGLLFYRGEEEAARNDFETLRSLSQSVVPPCRARVQLARLEGEGPAWVVALIYPAEYSDEIGRWLLDADYAGGDEVEGGTSAVTGYLESAKQIKDTHQIWGGEDGVSRNADEVLASTRQAVQR